MSLSFSCVPAKGVSDPIDDFEAELNDENYESGAHNQSEDTGATGSVDTSESEEQDQTEESDNSDGSNDVTNDGIWSLTEMVLVDDPCDWLELIPNFGDGIVPVSLEGLLPERFDVEGSSDSFKIKAKSYGARDFIECNVDNLPK